MAEMGRPRKDTLGVMVRLPIELVEAVDDIRRQQPDVPTRPEMIRRMIGDWINAERQRKEEM